MIFVDDLQIEILVRKTEEFYLIPTIPKVKLNEGNSIAIKESMKRPHTARSRNSK
jgi:hypothetical protein